jgi:hypothetical protein
MVITLGDQREAEVKEAEMTAKAGMLGDITQLILDDHETFRREFAALDDAESTEELREIWEPLAALLEVHAAAEESIFYPQLLRRGNNAEDETIDAIGDHNDIRDGVQEAARHPLGSPEWWAGVRQARTANSDHMAEEEDDALVDFRRNTPLGVREELGRQFINFKNSHVGAQGLNTNDKDPQQYLNVVQDKIASGETEPMDTGNLKDIDND